MIESITISKTASYGSSPSVLNGLSKFNYVYGANGSGKTTISRIIKDESAHTDCHLSWSSADRLETLVYNQDFVENNFNQSNNLKGVFTLGENSVNTEQQIKEAKDELDRIDGKINGLNTQLGSIEPQTGKQGELAELETTFKDHCFAAKRTHDLAFKDAFTGYRNDAEKFKAKILEEEVNNNAVLLTLEELKRKAKSIFGEAPEKENLLTTVTATELLKTESNQILQKRIIGKEDVDIAGLIQKLDNSDWVKKGTTYLDASEGNCPFCQQSLPSDLTAQINEYFSENFERETQEIETVYTDYQTNGERLIVVLDQLVENTSQHLDKQLLKVEVDLFKTTWQSNLQLLIKKKKEPSKKVELHSLQSCIDSITQLINDTNTKIQASNRVVDNLRNEKSELTKQVWKYLLENDLKTALQDYKSRKTTLEATISGMQQGLKQQKTLKVTKESEIGALERLATSIQPTIDEINRLLKDFGFHGFSLNKSSDGKAYQLIRPNGADAKDSLSEGEKTFITFLYFYQSLKGSHSESGMTRNRIAVFDDPISSLDADILFIVSSLIKGLIEEVRQNKSYIKQVFVLTHNIYFFKEITFNPNRDGTIAMNEETFWIVRKSGLESTIEGHENNPIRTSYELLWAEVRNPDRSSLSIQNTLRRILENYFKILGNKHFDTICNKFEGKQRLLCKSLFSWVNDGSHNAMEDLYISSTEAQVEGYLEVFKQVFYKTDHHAHYHMMMGTTQPVPEPV